MAAGLMSNIAGDTVLVYSSGAKPRSAVNDLSTQALAEVGIDIAGQTPKLIDQQLVRDVHVVVTLGREAPCWRSNRPIRRPAPAPGNTCAASEFRPASSFDLLQRPTDTFGVRRCPAVGRCHRHYAAAGTSPGSGGPAGNTK